MPGFLLPGPVFKTKKVRLSEWLIYRNDVKSN